MAGTDPHTNYRTPRTNFPKLNEQAYRLTEIWSLDVAHLDNIEKYNNDVKFLLVAVDAPSRLLRVEPMKTKNATDTTRAFNRMTTKFSPERVGSDKGTEFREEFDQLCDSQIVELYSTHSETKSVFG